MPTSSHENRRIISSMHANDTSVPPEWLVPPREDHVNDTYSELLEVLDLEIIDPLLFRGFSPKHPRWGRLFGGQAVAQALIAASRTVDPPFQCHSLHSYFLRAGDDTIPILYSVELLRNGRNFVARRVTATQRGRPIFVAELSFQKPELNGLEHQDMMPDQLPAPETLPSLVQQMKAWEKDPRLSESVRAGIARSSSMPFAFDIRRAPLEEVNGDHSAEKYLDQRLSKQSHATQNCYMRVTGKLCDSLIIHQAALAYLSDWSFLETTLLPHGIHSYQNTPERSIQMASLDHSLYFHRPFRADEWLLYTMHSPWAGGSRGFVRGEFYDKHGALVVSATQEGLIRLRIQPSLKDATSIQTDPNRSADRRAADRPSSHFTILPAKL